MRRHASSVGIAATSSGTPTSTTGARSRGSSRRRSSWRFRSASRRCRTRRRRLAHASFSSESDCSIAPTRCRASSREASSSESRSARRWRTVRSSSSPTSRRAIWTRSPRARSSRFCPSSSGGRIGGDSREPRPGVDGDRRSGRAHPGRPRQRGAIGRARDRGRRRRRLAAHPGGGASGGGHPRPSQDRPGRGLGRAASRRRPYRGTGRRACSTRRRTRRGSRGERRVRRYGAQVALDSVDAVVPPGQLSVVVGPSGSGKSTLLALLCRPRRPGRGRDPPRGEVVSQLDRAARAALRRDRIAVVGQAPGLSGFLSARENVELGLALRGIDSDERGNARRMHSPPSGSPRMPSVASTCCRPDSASASRSRGCSPRALPSSSPTSRRRDSTRRPRSRSAASSRSSRTRRGPRWYARRTILCSIGLADLELRLRATTPVPSPR